MCVYFVISPTRDYQQHNFFYTLYHIWNWSVLFFIHILYIIYYNIHMYLLKNKLFVGEKNGND